VVEEWEAWSVEVVEEAVKRSIDSAQSADGDGKPCAA